jgi:hypothetical protein
MTGSMLQAQVSHGNALRLARTNVHSTPWCWLSWAALHSMLLQLTPHTAKSGCGSTSSSAQCRHPPLPVQPYPGPELCLEPALAGLPACTLASQLLLQRCDQLRLLLLRCRLLPQPLLHVLPRLSAAPPLAAQLQRHSRRLISTTAGA